MIKKVDELEKKLAKLRKAYTATLTGKLDELEVLAEDLSNADPPVDYKEILENLRIKTHNLAGSAGTYGFSELGIAAKSLELKCQALIESKASCTSADHREILHLIDDIKQACEDDCTQEKIISDASTKTPHHYCNTDAPTDNHTALLVSNDPSLYDHLKAGLSAFGYHIEVTHNLCDIQQTIQTHQPSAILLDLELDFGKHTSTTIIKSIRSAATTNCLMIALTNHDYFEARLKAARAGCDFFLIKPITLDTIIHILSTLNSTKETELERVLVIDDDPDMLDFVCNILKSEAMLVECLSDPTQVIDVMARFDPELILIDLYMPQCSGKEVAAIIRQKQEYTSTPIVFLSSECDQTVQTDAMIVGADDFLTKPIKPKHLIAAVRLRIERFRTLRSIMIQDSLTNLYNHATIWQLLEIELSRAMQAYTTVSFAILDIDYFKSVNNTYGYETGDNILKALAKVITHRVRGNDMVGRLGGEEFGIILPNTDVEEARLITDVIRISFTEVAQNIIGSSTPVTLSCGIASFPQYASARVLSEAANRALHQAKRNGNDKTVVLDKSSAESDLNHLTHPQAHIQQTSPYKTNVNQPRNAGYVKTAIVLDDDPMIGEFLKPFAECAGFRIQTIADPVKFTETYDADIDLIMLDLNMPDIDGIELLRFLGEQKCKAAIIIISIFEQEILTAAKALAKRHGLNIVCALRKPFDQGELISALRIAYSTSGIFCIGPSQIDQPGMPSVEELRAAINNHTLEVFYQPKIQLHDNTLIGIEALSRWKHPKLGFIPPDYFIPLAEQNGLINDLTDFVVQETCTTINYYRSQHDQLKIAINLSAHSFDDLNFPEKILNSILQSGTSVSNFILELTETSLVNDFTHVIEILTRLRLKGFQMSIDDYGTGHSSLTRLHELPFNELKIDKSFVSASHAEPSARAIVKNTIELAKSLGLKTVAEGVELQEHVEILKTFGCDIVQGYLISKPFSRDELVEWLDEDKRLNF